MHDDDHAARRVAQRLQAFRVAPCVARPCTAVTRERKMKRTQGQGLCEQTNEIFTATLNLSQG